MFGRRWIHGDVDDGPDNRKRVALFDYEHFFVSNSNSDKILLEPKVLIIRRFVKWHIVAYLFTC